MRATLLVRLPFVLFLLSGIVLSLNPFSQADVSAFALPSAQNNLAVSGISERDKNPQTVTANWQISFSTETAESVLINEVDAVAGPLDDAEFIELFDGGIGGTPLDGLSIVLFSGHDDSVYAAFDLSGQQTDVNGYFLLGNSDVPGVDLIMADSLLQSGADAVALYSVQAAQMPVGTAVTEENLLDALVYDTDDEDDPGLLPLLLPGEIQVNENGRYLELLHSLQRCPDGSGGQRTTATYWPDTPTPKQTNTCVIDERPQVSATTPGTGAINVPLDSEITVTFSEDVVVSSEWLDLNCQQSGNHTVLFDGAGSHYNLHVVEPFAYSESCQATIFADKIRDLDAADPPDHLSADVSWTFTVMPALHMVINELDADTPGLDTAEFIELTDGGEGHTNLDGLVLVLFNGADDLSYRAIDLGSYQTDARGRFLVGGSLVPGVDLALPDGTLQNGPDAVALYTGSAADFPVGSPVSTGSLLDAVVYGDAGEPDAGLLTLLAEGEKQLDEDGRDNAPADSLQRCPDGAGGQRHSASFLPNLPTPGEANRCTYDAAPQIIALSPAAGEEDVAPVAQIVVTFSEAVDLADDWISLRCEKGGSVAFSIQHQEDHVTLIPLNNLLANDSCTVTILADHVHDRDGDDPPDTLAGNVSSSFTTVSIPVARHVIINEVDSDTPGADTAEFIELYDGGDGNTLLDGLVVVLFNGTDYRSYRSFGLDGYRTDAKGYFVLGNMAVAGVDYQLGNGTVQNGPDAVALYAAAAAEFPAGTAVTSTELLDALVYGTGSDEAPRLMRLLRKGEAMVDEDGRGFKDVHSNQRCPNGDGGQRRTASYLQNQPTPKEPNFCLIDEAPFITAHMPAAGAESVPLDVVLSITFSEAVSLEGASAELHCDRSGEIDLALSGGPFTFALEPQEMLLQGETCTAAVSGAGVIDLDELDPPDTMAGGYAWSFESVSQPLARHMLINEVDSDTPGADTAEFIELYDGGDGNTNLDGLEVVLINGATDSAYRHIDLAGYQTDKNGYFLIGGSDVPGVELVVGRGSIQNGPDAVALYAAKEGNDSRGDEQELLDAVVYHTNDEIDPGLNFLLLKNEPQINEGQQRDTTLDSSQRCPNGQGGQRVTSGYIQNQPTPGTANNCTVDTPPSVVEVFPADGAQEIPLDAILSVQFDEDVQLDDGWIALSCEQSDEINLFITGGPQQYTIQHELLPQLDTCAAKVFADKVKDTDGYADSLKSDFTWMFATRPNAVVSAGFTSSSPVTIGESIQFFNTSQGTEPLNFEWDFGDGSRAVNVENPQHLYTAAGTYTVTLTATDGAGATGIFSAPVEIVPIRIFVPLSISLQ